MYASVSHTLPALTKIPDLPGYEASAIPAMTFGYAAAGPAALVNNVPNRTTVSRMASMAGHRRSYEPAGTAAST